MPSSDAPDIRPGTDRLPGGACIPPFLEEWKVKILRTGKYLNVIRECGLPVEGDVHPEEDLPSETRGQAVDAVINMDGSKWVPLLARFVEFEIDDVRDCPRFHRIVDDAYLTANQRLLDMMLKEQGLITYLR